MDDGGKNTYGQTILHTNSFTLLEVQLLQKALLLNFKLRRRLEEKTPDKWIIIIPVRQDIPLYNIVRKYKHKSMMYKLHQK